MSAKLWDSDEPAGGAVAVATTQPQSTSPPEPASLVAEDPAPQRPGPLLRMHRAVRKIAPWGILIAVIMLLLSFAGFWIDYTDRVQQRTARAWQLMNTPAPGNSGKKEALEYLNGEDGFFCGDNGCLITLKPRLSLAQIELPGAYLRHAELSGADLSGANLSGADLSGADLSGANLSGADLTGAYLMRVNLTDTNLSGSNLTGAQLIASLMDGTDLSGSNLTGARLITSLMDGTDLTDTNLSGTNFTGNVMWLR